MALGKPFPKKLPGEQGFLAAIMPIKLSIDLLIRLGQPFEDSLLSLAVPNVIMLWILALKLFKSSFESCARGEPRLGGDR